MTVGRIIETPACVAEGASYLAAIEPRFAHALDLTGPLPLRRRKDGFEALLDAIVSQQVSVQAPRGDRRGAARLRPFPPEGPLRPGAGRRAPAISGAS